MNTIYNAIISEIPEVDELKNVLADSADRARTYESIIVLVYRRARVDQLNEWIKTKKGK